MPNPETHALSPSQAGLKAMTEEVFSLKSPDNPMKHHSERLKISGGEVLDILARSEFAQILTPDGVSLLDQPAHRRGPIPSQENLISGRDIPQIAVVKAYVDTQEFELTDGSVDSLDQAQTEKYWDRVLSIVLQYNNGFNAAHQVISASTTSDHVGIPPFISRKNVDVGLPSEMSGGQGHDHLYLPDQTDAVGFAYLALFSQLYDQRESFGQ